MHCPMASGLLLLSRDVNEPRTRRRCYWAFNSDPPKRDAAAAQRFLTKALGGENHPEPRVINSDTHAAYPPAIAVLQAAGDLADNCQHRPVQYLNNVLEGSPGDQASDQREPAFPLVLVCVVRHRRLRSDSYYSQRPGVRECGGCEGRSS
jgi:hypothetical protein